MIRGCTVTTRKRLAKVTKVIQQGLAWHPRLQGGYTGHEKTPSRFLFFWPFLTKTKQEWPLPGHIQSEFLLGTLHFGAPYFDPIFGPKMVILAIDTSNCPKWVENWLNKVEHCISHPGGSIWALKAPKNRNAKNGHFGQKIGNFQPLTPPTFLNRLNIGWTRLRIVFHIQGGLFEFCGPPKTVMGGPQKRQKWPFWAKNWLFLTVDTSNVS